MPASELSLFEVNLQRAFDLSATAASLAQLVTPAVDLSDLYRAAYMQGVSAFDQFMHDEIRVRMINWFSSPQSTWPAGFASFKVTMASTHATGRSSFDSVVRFEAEIRNQHGHLSFQHPDKVAMACRLVSDVDIWQNIAISLNTKKQGKLAPNQVIKKDWGLIIDRRNLIGLIAFESVGVGERVFALVEVEVSHDGSSYTPIRETSTCVTLPSSRRTSRPSAVLTASGWR